MSTRGGKPIYEDRSNDHSHAGDIHGDLSIPSSVELLYVVARFLPHDYKPDCTLRRIPDALSKSVEHLISLTSASRA